MSVNLTVTIGIMELFFWTAGIVGFIVFAYFAYFIAILSGFGGGFKGSDLWHIIWFGGLNALFWGSLVGFIVAGIFAVIRSFLGA